MSSQNPQFAFSGSDPSQPLPPCLMNRITSIASYIALNKDLPSHEWHRDTTLWPRLQGFAKKEQSIIGEKTETKEKVTIKTCTVGRGCTIGSKSKLNNSVLMDGVIVGESVIIQNSVICSGAVIESSCNLNEVYVGAKAQVRIGSKLKGETVTAEQ